MSASESAVYPMSQKGPPLLEPSNSPVMEDLSSVPHDRPQNSVPVAQLPVNATETHQYQHHAGTPYVRSQSMPIPNLPDSSVVPPSGSLTPTLPNCPNQGEMRTTTAAKIEYLKNWSISTYKCTKQLISEKLGKSSRTMDTEIESQIDNLRDVQRKYLNILRLARALSSHFQHVVVTQQGLGEAFADLAQKSPELQSEFLCNAETQRSLSRHGEVLLAALNFFVSSVNTLVNKTMEDTLLTVKRYEAARCHEIFTNL